MANIRVAAWLLLIYAESSCTTRTKGVRRVHSPVAQRSISVVRNIGLRTVAGTSVVANTSSPKKTGNETMQAVEAAGTSGITISAAITPLRSKIFSWRPQLVHLYTGLSFAVFVKLACMVGNVAVQVSPMPQVKGWEDHRSTGNADSAPYVSMGLGGFQWCTYGLAAQLIRHNDGFLTLVYANLLGFVLGSYYTWTFWRNCRDLDAVKSLKGYLTAVVLLLAVQGYLWLSMPPTKALVLHSWVAALCSLMSALALLTCLPTVLRTGDTSVICGPLVLTYFVGALLWADWGWLMDDFIIVGTNMFAAVCSFTSLYVKSFHFHGKSVNGDGGRLGDSWGTLSVLKAQRMPSPGEWELLVAMPPEVDNSKDS